MLSGQMGDNGWLKLNVRRDRKHERIVELLCQTKTNGKSVFSYNKDLMVFAAMVGYSHGSRKPISGDGISIILETYASDQKDAFIYLIALMTVKEGTILKDERLPEAIKIFEEYCNAGLEKITLWIEENPGDPTGVESLIEKIWEKVIKNESSSVAEISPDDVDVEF